MNSELPPWSLLTGGILAGLFTLWMVATVVLDYNEQPNHTGPLGVLMASDSKPAPEGK